MIIKKSESMNRNQISYLLTLLGVNEKKVCMFLTIDPSYFQAITKAKKER